MKVVVIKKEEWENLYTQVLKLDDPDFALEIPCEPLPHEEPVDTVMRYLSAHGILFEDGEGGYWVDLNKAEALSGNYRKFFEALAEAETAYELDELEKDGFIQSGVDESGNIVYAVTEAGQKAIEDN